jgi:hypothetical protein
VFSVAFSHSERRLDASVFLQAVLGAHTLFMAFDAVVGALKLKVSAVAECLYN